MLVGAMLAPAPSRFSRRALSAGLLLLAGLVASCSNNDTAPLQPGPDPKPAPTPMFSVVGDPHVAVRFNGLLNEPSDSSALTGNFSVTLRDSSGKVTFLPDVRMNGVPMLEELDGLGQPSRYTLDAALLVGLTLSDTLKFQAVDGGTLSPPFTFLITPSHLTMPPDSTMLHDDTDVVMPWNGIVERVLVTVTDLTGRRLRYNLQVENYSGDSELTIPGRDFAAMFAGDIFVGTDVLDGEVRITNGSASQIITMETRQTRLWRLEH
jgi:hypothetical protein